MKQIIIAVIMTVVSIITTPAAACAFEKPGIAPSDETLRSAGLYCHEVYQYYRSVGADKKAMEWSDKITQISHGQIAYYSGDCGIWFKDVEVYAKKYEEQAHKADRIDQAIERIRLEKIAGSRSQKKH